MSMSESNNNLSLESIRAELRRSAKITEEFGRNEPRGDQSYWEGGYDACRDLIDLADEYTDAHLLDLVAAAQNRLLDTEQELAHDLLHHSWISVSYLAGKANQMRAFVEQWDEALDTGPTGCRHGD